MAGNHLMGEPHRTQPAPRQRRPSNNDEDDERGRRERPQAGHNWTITHHAGLNFALYNTADSLVITLKRAVAGHILEEKGRCEQRMDSVIRGWESIDDGDG